MYDKLRRSGLRIRTVASIKQPSSSQHRPQVIQQWRGMIFQMEDGRDTKQERRLIVHTKPPLSESGSAADTDNIT